jgi:isopentenyldiphosphate isomerase
MTTALIQIVDSDDAPLYGGTKEDAWNQGLFHRIARILITDEKGSVLLQKRATTKHPYPGYWDNSAAGHVDEGESYEIAVARELEEELGITGVDAHEVDYYKTTKVAEGKKLNRFNKLFTAVVDSSVAIRIDPEELDEARWFTREEAVALLDSKHVTDGLRFALEKYYL